MESAMSDCCGGPKLVFACSGAADVGAIADRAARALSREGAGKMYCMAGLGGDVGPIVETTRKASAILAIDGCGVDCVRHTLERLGFKDYAHMRVTDLGLEKGSSPANDENVAKAAGKAAEKLA
jgi:uncharacterized metal-binding protein